MSLHILEISLYLKEGVSSIPHWLCSPPRPPLILHLPVYKCAGRAGERKVRLPSLCCGKTLILRETLSGTVISITVLFVPTTSLPVFITTLSGLICLLFSFILSGPFSSQALRPHPPLAPCLGPCPDPGHRGQTGQGDSRADQPADDGPGRPSTRRGPCAGPKHPHQRRPCGRKPWPGFSGRALSIPEAPGG